MPGYKPIKTGCGDKKPLLLHEAKQSLAAMLTKENDKPGTKFNIYKCKTCNYFHLGRTKGKTAIIALPSCFICNTQIPSHKFGCPLKR